MMKRSAPTDVPTKFSGNMRHYHRSGSKTQRTWDDWVDGHAAKVPSKRNWPKIVGILLGILALAGIIAGLIIELS